jgi:hypothetical protein
MIGLRGRLLVDGVLCTTECANGTRVWICRHIDGTVSLVLNKPEKGTAPKVVFLGRRECAKTIPVLLATNFPVLKSTRQGQDCFVRDCRNLV